MAKIKRIQFILSIIKRLIIRIFIFIMYIQKGKQFKKDPITFIAIIFNEIIAYFVYNLKEQGNLKIITSIIMESIVDEYGKKTGYIRAGHSWSPSSISEEDILKLIGDWLRNKNNQKGK